MTLHYIQSADKVRNLGQFSVPGDLVIFPGQAVKIRDCPCKIGEQSYITSSLYHNCESTTIRLRYDDATTHSTTTQVIEITICFRFDCDTTTTRLRRKIDMLIFCSRRIASNGSRRARHVVVVSQSKRMQIVISITSVVVVCVVVSLYRSRSRFAIVITALHDRSAALTVARKLECLWHYKTMLTVCTCRCLVTRRHSSLSVIRCRSLLRYVECCVIAAVEY